MRIRGGSRDRFARHSVSSERVATDAGVPLPMTTRVSLCCAVLLTGACTVQDHAPSLCGESVMRGSDRAGRVETIDTPELPGVFVTSEHGKVSVGVYQAGTCAPYLTLGDRDADGVFDLLTYSALSDDGRVLVEVEDYGMDGQPDFILNFAESSASVYYRGTWYAVDGVGKGSSSVRIDGQPRPLTDVLAEIGRVPF